MMFGGACTQTPELMPLPAALSRALANRLTECVHSNDLLRADGKTQVSVEFDENDNVVGIDTVVVSVMHSADFEIEELRKYIKDGSTVADFIRDVQRRQQMEAEHVREARGMIMESLAKDDPAQARELYDAINKHMNEKGLPKVRIARKFLKMMEVEE
jgi:S-adenosylmethionine synthetase